MAPARSKAVSLAKDRRAASASTVRPIDGGAFAAPILAPEAMEVARRMYNELRPAETPLLQTSSGQFQKLRSGDSDFCTATPRWQSDIAWISPLGEASFRFFQALFDRLQIAQQFAFLCEVCLFSAFFVRRRAARKTNFHRDFPGNAKTVFTFMAPLHDMSRLSDCQLLCQDHRGRIRQYRYQLGQAIVFGGEFVHSTETGVAPQPLAFLCFTFGDRRMLAHQWLMAEKTCRAQSFTYQNLTGRVVELRPMGTEGFAWVDAVQHKIPEEEEGGEEEAGSPLQRGRRVQQPSASRSEVRCLARGASFGAALRMQRAEAAGRLGRVP